MLLGGSFVNATTMFFFVFNLDMRHIQYLAQTLSLPLVLAFHLVLGKFHFYDSLAVWGVLRRHLTLPSEHRDITHPFLALGVS